MLEPDQNPAPSAPGHHDPTEVSFFLKIPSSYVTLLFQQKGPLWLGTLHGERY